jgi:hypothetical protein
MTKLAILPPAHHYFIHEPTKLPAPSRCSWSGCLHPAMCLMNAAPVCKVHLLDRYVRPDHMHPKRRDWRSSLTSKTAPLYAMLPSGIVSKRAHR